AAGGILTELLGWRGIFLVQGPIGVLLLAAVGRGGAPAAAVSSRRPRVTPNLALLLLSGGLVAALFLLVLLLVTGRPMPPPAAGVVVSVLPVAALLSGRFVPSCTGLRVRIASGVVLVAGGLAALALLPRAGWAWTLVPQVLIGVGVGLALAALTEQALEGRGDVVHRGWAVPPPPTAPGPSPRGTPASSSACSSSRRSSRRRSSGTRTRRSGPGPRRCSTAAFLPWTSSASRRTCSARWTSRRAKASCPTSAPSSRTAPRTTSTGRSRRRARTRSIVR